MVVFSLVIVYYYLSIGDATWRVTRGQTLGGVSQCAAAGPQQQSKKYAAKGRQFHCNLPF